MNRLSKYKQIDPKHLAKLKDKKIKTVDDLWEAIGHKSGGVENLAKKAGLTEDEVVTILAACAKPEPRSKEKWDQFRFWLSNYWREAAALLMAVVLLALLVGNAVRRRDTVVVAAKETLPAYHVITKDDVRLEKHFRVSGSFGATEDVVGRYLIKPAKPGAVISSEQLGAALPQGVALGGRRVLSLPIRGGLISQTLAPHDRVRLLFSPRGAGAQPAATGERTVDDAVVLAVSRQGDASSVVVALKNDSDLNRIELLLGTSDIFIAKILP
jgi:hypothetical protein